MAPLLGAVLVGHPLVVSAMDPILMGPEAPDGPCATGEGGADYVPGVDVNGNPVAQANTDQDFHVRTEGDTVLAAVPQGARRHHGDDDTRVPVQVRGLSQALSPPPACPPRRKQRG